MRVFLNHMDQSGNFNLPTQPSKGIHVPSQMIYPFSFGDREQSDLLGGKGAAGRALVLNLASGSPV